MGSLARNGAVLLSVIAILPLGSLAGPLAAVRFPSDNLLVTPARLGVRDFVIGNCRAWSQSNPWDTCQAFLTRYSMTMAAFYRLNPSVESDCFSFVPGATYCRRTSEQLPCSQSVFCQTHELTFLINSRHSTPLYGWDVWATYRDQRYLH